MLDAGLSSSAEVALQLIGGILPIQTSIFAALTFVTVGAALSPRTGLKGRFIHNARRPAAGERQDTEPLCPGEGQVYPELVDLIRYHSPARPANGKPDFLKPG